MNKTAIAILATALMLPLFAGCNRKDEKAGYPGQTSGKQTQQPAPPQILQPDARRNESSPPGPPEHKTAADRRLLRNAGALGDLASAFCDASVKADAKARTAMFSDEFIVYAGLGEKIA